MTIKVPRVANAVPAAAFAINAFAACDDNGWDEEALVIAEPELDAAVAPWATELSDAVDASFEEHAEDTNIRMAVTDTPTTVAGRRRDSFRPGCILGVRTSPPERSSLLLIVSAISWCRCSRDSVASNYRRVQGHDSAVTGHHCAEVQGLFRDHAPDTAEVQSLR